MEFALTALRELSEANNNDATQHFRSYALTDPRVQKAASINRRDREDMARVAAAEAVAGTALGPLRGVPRKGRRGEGDRGEITDEDMAKVAAAEAVAGAALGLLRGVPRKGRRGEGDRGAIIASDIRRKDEEDRRGEKQKRQGKVYCVG